MPRTSIKGQVLADLVAEFAKCPKEMEGENQKLGERSIGVVSVQCPMPWELYVDGAVNQRGSGVELVLVSPEKITIEKSLRLSFSATNNEAEYEALLMVQKMGDLKNRKKESLRNITPEGKTPYTLLYYSG